MLQKENIFMKNNNFEVVTFGCRLNFYESQLIKEKLDQELSQNKKNSSTIIVNSCAVTQEAERKVQKSIKILKKKHPEKKIIVTGCAAQKNPTKFSQMIEVDRVVGNAEKFNADLYFLEKDTIDKKIVVGNIYNKAISQDFLSKRFITNFEKKTRAFVQVQNGCDRRCTFCVIPQLRGNSSSIPIEQIVAQIHSLMNNGYREIIFTGVNITGYGADLPGSPTFANMVKRVLLLVPKLQRLRLSSVDLGEIDQELFELICSEEKIMPHVHLSLQAGDNIILKRMKRRHNREYVIDFCTKLRKFRKDLAFGADIIAGFPTETESMFQNTKDLIREADLQYVHVFPYSSREGTPASRMPQLDKSVIKARALILREEAKKQLENYYSRYIGKRVDVLVENHFLSHTNNFIPVKILGCDGIDKLVGSIIEVELCKIVDQKYIEAKFLKVQKI